jgi:hypothetical protein
MAGTWRFRGKKDGKKQVWSTLTGIETIEPSLSHFAEQEHYMIYLSCKNYAKMKMLHTKYGALEKLEVNNTMSN